MTTGRWAKRAAGALLLASAIAGGVAAGCVLYARACVVAADGNRDGTITTEEARAASWKGARSVGEAMFESIDGNRDGQLNVAEFRKSLEAPAGLAFKAADRNADGRLTQDEAGTAIAQVAKQLGVPSAQL